MEQQKPSSKGEFIIRFIADSKETGLSALDAAKKEIHEIDEKLHEAEKLRLRRMKLMLVVEHFGDETFRRRRSVNVPSSEDIDENSEAFLSLQEKIRSVVAKKALTVREIVLEVGSYDQDVLIYRALKALGDKEVVLRDEQGRVKPGKKWT
jgi:hypothetical protein